MKYLFLKLTAVAVMGLQLICCGRNSSVYTLEFPEVPQAWVRILGEPQWRIEWIDPNGGRQLRDIAPRETMEVEIPSTWTNPVVASPFWPQYNLIPGIFKPAGALFPFDVSGGKLCLTWEAGVDVFFYWELAFANSESAARIPSNFDWLRFRELFNEPDALSEEVRNDPWLVDWNNAAEKTISGSFDRRRLVPQTVESIEIQLPVQTWYGTSPFAKPLVFTESEPLVFKAHSGINVWISSEGILRVNGKIWMFHPFE